jgi:drug/metabolite transporter (DMT)-like permease
MSDLVGGPTLPAATRARVAVPFILVTLIWGSTWLVIRDQLGVVPPSWSVTYRFALAGVAMFGWALVTRTPLRLGRDGHVMALAIGLAQFVLNFNFVYRAEHYVTSGLVAVVFALLVVPNAVLGRLVLGSRVSRPFLVGSAVALVGVALLFRHEMNAAGADPAGVATGIGLTLCAILSASSANIMQATQRARSVPIVALIAWAMLWGALADAAWALLTVGAPVIEWRLSYLAGIAWLALAGSTLAFPLYFNVIRAIGPARAAYSSVLVPVIAMTLSTLFEGYRWSLEAGVGAGLVIGGLVIALTARR